MYRKYYKSLTIGNFQSTILHIPNRNNGMMEYWNNSISCISCQGESRDLNPPSKYINHEGHEGHEGKRESKKNSFCL
jgi:hypothetical protein